MSMMKGVALIAAFALSADVVTSQFEGFPGFPGGGGGPPGNGEIIINGVPVGGDGAPTGDGVPPAGGEAPPAGGVFPPAGGVFPPAGGEVPPAGGVFPPAGGEVPPAGGGIPEAGGGFPPAAGGGAPVGGGIVGQQQFAAATAIAGGDSGTGDAQPGATNTAATQVAQESVVLEQQVLLPGSLLQRACPCVNADSVQTDDIRGISDAWASGGSIASSSAVSNMVWSFGQFVDHDLTLTIEDEGGPTFLVGSSDDDMSLHRAVTAASFGCPLTLNVHTPQIDATNIYGPQTSYLVSTLRAPGSCFMRASAGGYLPLTTNADANGLFHFLTGDVRVSEHAFLTAQHVVWLREHNRICALVDVDQDFASSSADAKFNLVRNIVTAKYQQVILREFLPALGITETDVQSAQRIMNRPDVTVEFSIAYRLGHDLIGDFVGNLRVVDGFNGEDFFLDHGGSPAAPTVTFKADAESRLVNVLTSLSTSRANEIDGRLSDALRNLLFGPNEQEDLAGRNIFRGRELGVPTYAGLAACYGTVANSQIEAETPDAWLGLLREPKTGGPLPPTLRTIIVEQFHRSIFGPGGVYWRQFQASLGKYLPEVEASTYAGIIATNTGAAVSGNVFSA